MLSSIIETMDIVHIPKNMAQKGDLVLIPKKEYERLMAGLNEGGGTLTAAEKKSLHRAEKEFREGKTMTLNELKKKMGMPRR
jgi:PHD/YefM family antitoxin component YafN of YafNO toxin-antitoxin module